LQSPQKKPETLLAGRRAAELTLVVFTANVAIATIVQRLAPCALCPNYSYLLKNLFHENQPHTVFNRSINQINPYFCYMSKKEKILNRILAVVNKTAPDSEIYLYGSRARGDAKKLSDWDILILIHMENISFDLETQFMDEFYELEIETGESISPLIYSKNDWIENHSITPLFENIQKEGVRIK
jgi:predicted nucleotidyltransferase